MFEEAVFIPVVGSEEELAHAVYLATLADPSRQGKFLARSAHRRIGTVKIPENIELVSASPGRDLSGVNLEHSMIREGAFESIEKWIRKLGGHIHCHIRNVVKQIAEHGDQAIVIATEKVVLGVVLLKVAKPI
ncbi:MAG: hypothetical protein ACXWR1_03165 [Bdellovibrionota bacterium]